MDTATASIEPLEPRQFLDGNVDVAFNGRTLSVMGDSADNALIVYRTDDRLEIVPLNGTSINGKPPGEKEIIDFTRLDAINVNMKEGNDRVFIQPYEADEGDTLPINVRCIKISGGPGDDVMSVGGVVSRQVWIYGGSGNNDAGISSWGGQRSSVQTIINKSLTYTGGDGNDRLSVAGVHVGDNVIANLGDGNNLVTVQTLEVDGPDFNMVIGHHLKIFGGAGNDSVLFDDYDNLGGISIGGYAILNLGGGNNDVANFTFSPLVVGGHFNITGDNLQVRLSGVNVGKNMKLVSPSGDSDIEVEVVMTGGHIQVYSLNGNSELRVSNAVLGGSLYANLTGPVVDVYLRSVTAQRAWLLGGPGINTLHDLGDLDFARPPIIHNFVIVS